ncbi:hypothetical protein JCGZ_06371 [Jatropha curcas]|uniref:AIG1-type G domain-containing protein n=1 Tax=Jatropha curcas TaxID=180498 RepID=A0A067J9I4_JATCU|nr:translocase of chloroplast 120, chloroplastic [Jatropha curcas]KDP20412.1 hypothetical protein JCGZ_06371 [Jatropha curcas]
MENGVERVGGLQSGEENNVESHVFGDKIEERVVVGSDGLKDFEEEVFEEAVDSQEQLQNLGEKFEFVVNVETIDNSSSAVVDENLTVGNEVETFEEAIGVPAEVDSPEELASVINEKRVDDLLGGESVDKIDEGGTSLVGGESVDKIDEGGTSLVGGEAVDKIDEGGITAEEGSNELNEEKEFSEIGGDGGIENLKDIVEVDVELSREISSGDGNKELKVDESGTEYKDNGESVDVPVQLQEDEGLHDDLPKIDKVSHNEENGKLKGDTIVLDSENGVPETEKQTDNSTSLDMKHHDDSNGDVIDAPALVDSEHLAETHLQNATEAVPYTEEETEMPEISHSHSGKLVNGSSEDIRAAAAHLKAGDNEDSEPPRADEKVNGVGKDIYVIEESEKIIEKDGLDTVVIEEPENVQEEKQITQGNGKQEISPPAKPASSSGKSTGPAPPPARPAGLGRAAPLLDPAPRAVQQHHQRVNGTMSHVQSQQIEDPTSGEGEEYDETREKLQMIRVKFLRLAHRLGQTPHNVVVAQVLYRLGLAEQLRGRNGGRVGAFSFDRASAMAEQLEAAGQEPLDFSCTIMVLGKTGVGKSATINSIFDEVKFGTDAFQLGTKKVQDVVGTVQGIKVRVIDTPGLLPSGSDQRQNEKILHSVKRFIKKTPPDIVLYLDRLDMQSRDFGDMPLLRTITEIFGPSIWFNAIVVLTHAASAPPDGPNGTTSTYDMFVTQRSHVVQQAIRQAAGDMRLMNPVSLVENHSACRTNRAGQRVLPNGQVWKPHLLLLSFASKILAEANTLLKLQDSPPGKPFAARSRAPPLPFLLSSLLQSRPQLKLPEEQFGDEDSLDDDLEESSDSEDESEYDDLPPFRSLTKAQVAKLTRAQKKAYFDELEYREKLFMKKQLKEEKRRRKIMKKMAAAAKDLPSDYAENLEEESGGAASVPVPMPDLALPASFDSDNPTHRYRYLDNSNQWLVRPVLETHGWDHDVGYEGINVERVFVVKDKIPISLSSQVTKDKKDANVQMELASSVKHGEGKSTSLGFDMQTVGKDLAYTLRSETRFSNYRKNKATAGLSFTLLGDALSAGLKVEDKLIVNKRFRMVVSGGAMTGRGDVAYGGSLEAQLRDKDYPLGRSLSTLGLSVMDWHGDLAVGCNIQSQVPIGRSTNLIARGNLNNKGAGQISIRVNSSEQLQIALVGLLPLLKKIFGYPQQMQY